MAAMMKTDFDARLHNPDYDLKQLGYVPLDRKPIETEPVFAKYVANWKRGERTIERDTWKDPVTDVTFHRRITRYNSFDSQSSRISPKKWQLYTCLTHLPEGGKTVVFRRDCRRDRVQHPH